MIKLSHITVPVKIHCLRYNKVHMCFVHIRMDTHIFHLSCKNHGIEENEEDNSSDSGDSNFDEEYYLKRPHPIPYEVIKDKIIKIGNRLLLKILKDL